MVGDVAVAAPAVVLRHLDVGAIGGLSGLDRVELAVEHSAREHLVDLALLGGRSGRHPGEALLREVLRRRPAGEPPTESYAETRAVQQLRSIGIVPWRQVPILGGRRRADFMVPFRRMRRPETVMPSHGVLVEIYGRQFHEATFEDDHRRQTLFDDLGFRWLSFTPNQIEHEWPQVARVIGRALEQGRHPQTGRRTPTTHQLGRKAG